MRRYVVVDMGGRDAPVVRSALLAADTILIPMVPSAFDAWASDHVFGAIEAVRSLKDVEVLVVAKQVTATISAREALDVLREQLGKHEGLTLLDCAIYARTAWPRAVGEGMSVVEYEPTGKAAAELAALSQLLGIRP